MIVDLAEIRIVGARWRPVVLDIYWPGRKVRPYELKFIISLAILCVCRKLSVSLPRPAERAPAASHAALLGVHSGFVKGTVRLCSPF